MVASPSLVTLLIWSGKPPEKEERSCIHEFGKNIFIGFSTDFETLFMCIIDMLYSPDVMERVFVTQKEDIL